MSIVISVIDKNDSLLIASDKRLIKMVLSMIILKDFEIKDNLYFGMTGIAEDGFIYLAHIKIHKKKVCSQFISICDKLFPYQ